MWTLFVCQADSSSGIRCLDPDAVPGDQLQQVDPEQQKMNKYNITKMLQYRIIP